MKPTSVEGGWFTYKCIDCGRMLSDHEARGNICGYCGGNVKHLPKNKKEVSNDVRS